MNPIIAMDDPVPYCIVYVHVCLQIYYRKLVIKRTSLLSAHYLLSACTLLVTSYCGVAFYEPDLDRLESMWSPDIFGEMMAICKKISRFRQIASTGRLERQL